MGYWSDRAIRDAETGINREAIKDRRVCQACFEDRHIREAIERNCDTDHCDYCGANGEAVAAAPLASVVEFILGQLELEYAAADQTLPRDPETKERMFPEDEFDTRTMLELYVDLGLPNDDDGTLIADISEALPEQDWCLINPLGVRDDEAIGSSWNAFKHIVMHERRFFFHRYQDEALEYGLTWGEARYDPSDLLDAIGHFARDHGLLTRLPKGTSWYRVQSMQAKDTNFDARRMGPPPLEHANLPNRMSPVGIPMFYGAAETETALAEVAADVGRFACGRFETLRDIVVLDVRQPTEIPSLFDPNLAKDRAIAKFMQSFIEEFSKPIDREQRPHIDYLPTQVVTEYVRTMMSADNDQPIEGVLYRSSRNGRDAVVLFATNEDVVASNDDSSAWLNMIEYQEVDFSPKGEKGTH